MKSSNKIWKHWLNELKWTSGHRFYQQEEKERFAELIELTNQLEGKSGIPMIFEISNAQVKETKEDISKAEENYGSAEEPLKKKMKTFWNGFQSSTENKR